MTDRATCTNFVKGACAAGADIEQLRDEDLRLPCLVIRGVTGAVNCDLRELPNSAPNDAPGRLVHELENRLAGLCPTCEQPVVDERLVEGRVVAHPCRHLLRSHL